MVPRPHVLQIGGGKDGDPPNSFYAVQATSSEAKQISWPMGLSYIPRNLLLGHSKLVTRLSKMCALALAVKKAVCCWGKASWGNSNHGQWTMPSMSWFWNEVRPLLANHPSAHRAQLFSVHHRATVAAISLPLVLARSSTFQIHQALSL